MSRSLIAFEISSPGKVILHGEHSVVYGTPAIAGVIGLRNYLTFRETKDSIIHILFDKMGFQYQLNINQFNYFHLKNFAKYKNTNLPNSINHEEYLSELQQFLRNNQTDLDDKKFSSLLAFFYLFSAILVDSQLMRLETGINIMIETDMSIGAGIGSSASYGVCLAGAFYFYSRFSEFENTQYEITNEIKDKISSWAFYSEKIMHGNPSGLDNTICTFGNIVKFYKGSLPTTINLKVPLKILLVDTGVSRSTAKLIQNVVELKEKFPKLIENIIVSIGALVDDAAETLENISGDADIVNYEKLKDLISINNNLLRSICVSHTSLERIFYLCDTHGFSSKLTGAGGGGYATVLLPPNCNKSDYEKLCADLTMNGFSWQATTIGGPGITFRKL